MYLVKGSVISGDAGHNCPPDNGVVSLRSEDRCTKEVWELIRNKLESKGYKTVDCTPWGKEFNSVGSSLYYRVKKANFSGSSLHLSIHFNSGVGKGVECWIGKAGGRAEKFADAICKSIQKLGYHNRGIKIGKLYVATYTTMPSVIIECAFIDSKEDMSIYDADKIATAIVEAITILGTE